MKDEDVVSIPMDVGDMLVWHQDPFHCSDFNRSDGQRIGKASVYMSGPQEAEIRERIRSGETRLGVNAHRPAICIDYEIQALREDATIQPPF